jgi:hypothetical protein
MLGEPQGCLGYVDEEVCLTISGNNTEVTSSDHFSKAGLFYLKTVF